MSDLPQGWARAILAEVCLHVEKHDPRQRPNGRFAYIDIGGIEKHRIVAAKSISGAEAPSRARQLVRAGDTLLSTVRTYLKKTALVTDELNGAIASTGFCVLRPARGMDPRFVFYRVIADDFVALLTAKQTGSSYPAVRDRDVLEEEVAVPPSAEQRRIVTAIEEHFSRLDMAESLLNRGEMNLGRMRDLVLELAAQGSLAPQDPMERPASETIEQLRARATESRDGSVREPKTPRKRSVFSDRDLPQLPAGWIWCRARDVCSVITNGDTPPANRMQAESGDVPFIKVHNLTKIGQLDFTTKRTFIDRETHEGELARSRLQPGDVLINIVGPPLGKVALVPRTFPEWNTNQAVVAFRTYADAIDPRLLAIWLQSARVVDRLLRTAKATAGQFNLALSACRDLPIPIPPRQEQERVLIEVERQLSLVDALAGSVATALRRGAALRQSILRQAFTGNLVPQDPSDEPASVLLERIAAERAAAPKPRRKRRVPA
jgi:type I restriction enzyme S subunit